MAGIALSPGVLGASISVQDEAALAAYPIAGITLGTVAYVVSAASKFTLQLSSAALSPGAVIAVNGVTGARWLAGGALDGLTIHQARLALYPEYSASVTGASVQTMSLTGMDGDADGDYDIFVSVVCGHASATFTIHPNGSGSNIESANTDGATGQATGTDWPLFANFGAYPRGITITDRLTMQGVFRCRTGTVRQIGLTGYLKGVSPNYSGLNGLWTDTATNLTSLVVASSQSDGIAAGSFIFALARGRS